jgi:N6-adenosine-specific RNA methylase IME4
MYAEAPERVQEIRAGYQVIYADPPWHYNDRGNLKTRFRGGAGQHYSLMEIDEICALPVGEIAARDAVLFLWITCPKLLEYGPRVLRAWGFRHATVGFAWVKVTKRSACGLCGDGKPFFGVGYYTKSNAELCLLATRGKKLKPATDRVSMLVKEPRGAHSEKPEEVARRVDLLYPDARKIELFARRERPGWTCIGSEITGNDIRTDLCRLLDEELSPESHRFARGTRVTWTDLQGNERSGVVQSADDQGLYVSENGAVGRIFLAWERVQAPEA